MLKLPLSSGTTVVTLNSVFLYLTLLQYVINRFVTKVEAKNSPKQGLPVLSATRLLHYAIFLSGFDYDIKYRETKKHGNADALSRMPLKVTFDVVADIADIFEIGQIETMAVTARDLARITKTDLELKPLYEKLLNGVSITGLGFPGKDGDYNLQKGVIFYWHRV
ncbi:hypothetical protein AVEN_268427-1 [Araneus ventricosus]|uniref:Uncharacterized protein n=1 Tax=Araneus ventricosus TaxID=182803 RepID=A0A4Y2DTD7_ARAVE|nr:hypothetical protein AVEN_268427-1 [Araneus ventricosus]